MTLVTTSVAVAPSSFQAWLRQPTTITGLATAGAAVMAAGMQMISHNAGASASVGAAVFAIVHLAINDNTVATDASVLAQAVANEALAPASHADAAK